jgi:non-heme chloroperoxidase
MKMKSVLSLLAVILLPAVSDLRPGAPEDAIAVRRIEVNGTELSYVERGEGEPVVFVHGALGDFRTWAPQVEALSKEYRVVSYSRRYHHPNRWAGDGSDYARRLHAEDLAAFLRALRLGPAHLVGHSYGGSLAALVALEHPESVRSLVLGEPSLFGVLAGPEEGAMLGRKKGELSGGALAPARKGEAERAARAFVKIMVGADVFDNLPAASRAVIMQNARTLGPMLETYFEPTRLTCERARKIKTPTLLMRGELSPEINRRIADRLGECLPDSEVFVLPGASHGLQMEKPEQFNEAIRSFIGGRGGSAGNITLPAWLTLPSVCAGFKARPCS